MTAANVRECHLDDVNNTEKKTSAISVVDFLLFF